MTSFTGLSPNNPTRYLGPNVAVNTVVTRNRAPTGADYRMPENGKLYPFDTYWLVAKDPTTGVQGDLWYLSKIAANVAYWIKLSGGGSGPLLGFIVPLGSSPVFPDVSGFVTYTSTAGTIAITGSTNTINFDLIGGSIAVDSFMVDAFTAPGTNPVLPTATGLVTITGGQVAAGTTANVIRTDSLAANTYTIEVQRSQAVATPTIGDNGVSHFDSSIFSVDSNAFVSLSSNFYFASGTFIPVLSFGGSSTGITYAEQFGQYTKIGNVVFIEFALILTSKGAATGVALISGMPYTSNNLTDLYSGLCNIAFTGLTLDAGYTYVQGAIPKNNTTFQPFEYGSGVGPMQLTDVMFANDTIFRASFFYFSAT